jgi:hypothetical protein
MSVRFRIKIGSSMVLTFTGQTSPLNVDWFRIKWFFNGIDSYRKFFLTKSIQLQKNRFFKSIEFNR